MSASTSDVASDATVVSQVTDVTAKLQTSPIVLCTITLLALLLTCLWQYARSPKRTHSSTKFPLLRLPPEIREKVYEYLVEVDPSYPRLQPEKNLWLSLSDGLTQLYITSESHMLRSRSIQRYRRQLFRYVSSWMPTTSLRMAKALKFARSNGWPAAFRSKAPLLFVSRQVHMEFMSVLCRRASFRLYIQDNNQDDKPLWNLSSAMARRIRRCDVKLIVTPGMTGSFDPRVAPAEWALGDRAVAEMKEFKRLEHMSLQIHACGNQIWNPAWLWHYTSQSFKKSQLRGFKTITFHLKADGWFAGEHYLQRNDEGGWDWHCSQGHFVCHDTVGTMPIRKFCEALYDECHECSRPLIEETE